MKKTTYAILALAILLLTALIACPALASTSTSVSFTLNLSTNQIQFKIPSGTTFNGTIETSGLVRFWVTSPAGAQIVNLGIIEVSNSFRFVAQQNGTYTFNFENDLSNDVQVTFSYSANPPLPNGGTGTALVTLLIEGAVAVAGSLLIIFVVRRKNKKVAELRKEISKME